MLLRSRSAALLPALLVAAALAAAAPIPGAGADTSVRTPIVVQASIRGVALGMTPADVRSVLGAPEGSGVSPNPIVGKVRVWRYPGLRIVFDSTRPGRTVLSVTTTSRDDQTVAGVGVGSPEADVARSVRGVRCATRYGYRSCMVGGGRPGQLVTDFSISRAGRVTRVTLSRVVD